MEMEIDKITRKEHLESVVVRDEVPEYHWWSRLPNIVLEKVDDPYEGWLLFTIRKIVGDGALDGVCYMSLRNLAKVAKMAHSTVAKKIRSLAEKGLIEAELKKAPVRSRGWEVWHITIPRSLWEDNEREWQERKVYGRRTDPGSVHGTPETVRGNAKSVHQAVSTNNHITKNRIQEEPDNNSVLNLKKEKLKGFGLIGGVVDEIAEKHSLDWIEKAIEAMGQPGGVVYLHREGWEPEERGGSREELRYRYLKGEYGNHVEY